MSLFICVITLTDTKVGKMDRSRTQDSVAQASSQTWTGHRLMPHYSFFLLAEWISNPTRKKKQRVHLSLVVITPWEDIAFSPCRLRTEPQPDLPPAAPLTSSYCFKSKITIETSSTVKAGPVRRVGKDIIPYLQGRD